MTGVLYGLAGFCVRNRNWFMPRWLDKVTPRISIEGAAFFARRDRIPDRGPEPMFTPSSDPR